MQRNILISCFIILALQLFPGCIKETCDPKETPAELTLFWDYRDQNGNELLREEIRDIMAYVFSADGYFVTSFHLGQNDIDVMKSYSLKLPPGDYKIISWANLLDRTQVTPAYPQAGTLLSEFKINVAENTRNNGHYLSSDSLFHAQLLVTANRKNQKYTFYFRREACYLRIIMEEFTVIPRVEVNGMYGAYDLEARILPQQVQYVPDVMYDNINAVYRADFVTLRPANTNQLNIELYDKETGALIYTLDLSAVLKELRIDTQKDDEVNILIRLRPLSGNRISVSVNNWNIITNIDVSI